MPDQMEIAIKELPRDREIVELFKKIAGGGFAARVGRQAVALSRDPVFESLLCCRGVMVLSLSRARIFPSPFLSR